MTEHEKSSMASLSVAAVLLYTAPAIVMLLSYVLFHEKLTANKILSLVLTLVGCILVTGILGSKEHLSAAGIFVGLGAGGCHHAGGFALS